MEFGIDKKELTPTLTECANKKCKPEYMRHRRLTLSGLNLPLPSSSTTSRELLSQFPTCSE